MDPRRQSFWDLHDFSAGHGLEVGPLHRPIIGKDEGDVSYVALEMHQGAIISGQMRPLMVGAEEEKPLLKLASKSA